MLGALLVLFGISMIPIEVSRILQGSLNRGKRGSYYLYPNYNVAADSSMGATQLSLITAFLPDYFVDGTNLASKGIIPYNSQNALAHTGANFPIQDKYLWPWSHAALLFCLVTIAAGILGIMSGCRKTYSTIYAFFALSLLSFFLSTFLIAYYAVHVYWQVNQNQVNRAAFSYSNLDYALGSTMLALSCVTCVLSFFSAIAGCMGAGVCKGPKAALLPMQKGNKQKPPKPAKQPKQPKPKKGQPQQQQQYPAYYR
jgi:cbb3-type cytochrome oxidase subunit 3